MLSIRNAFTLHPLVPEERKTDLSQVAFIFKGIYSKLPRGG